MEYDTQYLVFVNVVFKTSIRNKLQYNTIVLTLKNHCIQCDNIHMFQYVSFCLILQFISRSTIINSKILSTR